MPLVIIITLLSIFFSYLLPPCASLQTQLQPSFQNQAKAHQHLSLPRLVRKMRAAEQAKGYNEARDLASHKQTYLSGKQHPRKQKMVLGSKGRQEWVDGEDPSKYFAKDYAHVGRRRPIHN